MQGFVIQSKRSHSADIGGFDQEIRIFEQPKQERAPALVIEVASDPALAPRVRSPVDGFLWSIS